MKKFFFVLAFAVCCSVAFAAEKGADPESPTPKEPEAPCLKCAICGDYIVCVFASDCEIAMTALDNELSQMGCGKKKSTELEGGE